MNLKGQSDSCIGKGRTWAHSGSAAGTRHVLAVCMARVNRVEYCMSLRSSQGHRRASRVSDLLQ